MMQAHKFVFYEVFYVNNFSVAIAPQRIQYGHNFSIMRRISSLLAIITLSAQLAPITVHAE